jgi:hypothetical protein
MKFWAIFVVCYGKTLLAKIHTYGKLKDGKQYTKEVENESKQV